MTTLNHLAVRQALELKGYSVSEVARLLGENRANLSQVLNGRRKGSPALAVRIAAITGDNPFTFLGPDDPKAAVIDLCRRMGITAADLEGAA